jgi:hypothetical protein
MGVKIFLSDHTRLTTQPYSLKTSHNVVASVLISVQAIPIFGRGSYFLGCASKKCVLPVLRAQYPFIDESKLGNCCRMARSFPL